MKTWFIIEFRVNGGWKFHACILFRKGIQAALDSMSGTSMDPADWRLKPSTEDEVNSIREAKHEN